MTRAILPHWRGSLLRRFAFVCASAFFAIFIPSSSQAQTAPTGSGRLAVVTVSGSVKFHSDQIVPVTGLRVGEQVTRDDLQKGADALANIGLFDKVQYRFATGASGVEVYYEVADGPAIPVFFDNFPWLSDADLIAGIKTSVPLFDGTAPDHGTILDDISNALTRQLQAHAITANVAHEVVILRWDEEKVVRLVAEGAIPTIQRIEFSDALAGSDHAIGDRLHDIVGKPYSRSAIATFEFEQVRPVYLSHAFLQVKFGEATPQIESNHVVLHAPIEAGPAYVWNGVTWLGNQTVSSADLTKLVDLNLGGPADGMKIQSTWENVRNAYARLGHLDMSLNPFPNFHGDTKLVSYIAKITEGPQYHMGNLVLSGLSMEGERRIRSAWKIPSGAVFDDSFYQEFLENGIKQALAGLPVHYEKIGRFLDKNEAASTINVMLDFQ